MNDSDLLFKVKVTSLFSAITYFASTIPGEQNRSDTCENDDANRRMKGVPEICGTKQPN
jgi:hypothetical protein